MAETLSGGDMLIRALQDAGVEYVFGYPGGAALHIYDAIFRQQKVEHILVRHEQAATHMADGYARATGKPGVVLVTSGPGATNAITGIATAYMDSIPMIIISGQVPNELIGTDAFQETDMVGVSRPMVKHSFMVKNCAEIPSVVKQGVSHRHHRAARAGGHRRPQGHDRSVHHRTVRLSRVGDHAVLQSGGER
jgi:acetolactate synthase I/II/III large subunit